MTSHSDEQLEAIAWKWREAAGQTSNSRLDAQAFIRWLKHNGYIVDYICVQAGDPRLRHADGQYDSNERRIYFRQSTWDCAASGNPHDIWTLIHEASHAICQHQEIRHRATGKSKNWLSRGTGADERDANRLTACLLAPRRLAHFKPGMTAEEIARLFGLSQEAATRRLEEFERSYRQQHSIPRRLPDGIVDFLEIQKRRGYQVTSLDAHSPLPARSAEYEGDPCPACGALRLIRSGVARRCENCDAKLGDD